jgi:hypothetical protein
MTVKLGDWAIATVPSRVQAAIEVAIRFMRLPPLSLVRAKSDGKSGHVL